VAEVAVAFGTTHFGAHHPMAPIFDFFDGIRRRRSVIAGPTRSRIEFRLGIEKRGRTTNAGILPVGFVVPKFARECSLGAAKTRYRVLAGGKLLALRVVGFATVAHDVPRGGMLARNGAKFETSPANFLHDPFAS